MSTQQRVRERDVDATTDRVGPPARGPWRGTASEQDIEGECMAT